MYTGYIHVNTNLLDSDYYYIIRNKSSNDIFTTVLFSLFFVLTNNLMFQVPWSPIYYMGLLAIQFFQ